MKYVYIVTRVKDSNVNSTPIPNLGVYECPVRAIKHFRGVVIARNPEAEVVTDLNDFVDDGDTRYQVLFKYVHAAFGEATEEIRLERWVLNG